MSGRLIVSVMVLSLAGFAGAASAQTAPQGERPRQPAATAAQPNATTTGQPQRRRQRPANAQNQQRPANAQAQRPAGQGGLNLDLNSGGRTVDGATRRPGDTFAVSGPYATDAQMQRYTGRRNVQMPRAPIQMFQQDENDNVTGYRR